MATTHELFINNTFSRPHSRQQTTDDIRWQESWQDEDLFQAERQEREREWLHCNHAVTTTPTRRTTTTVHTKHTYTTILYESIYECHAYIYSVFYSIHCLSNVDDVDMIERLFGYLLGKKTDKEDEKMINGDKK